MYVWQAVYRAATTAPKCSSHALLGRHMHSWQVIRETARTTLSVYNAKSGLQLALMHRKPSKEGCQIRRDASMGEGIASSEGGVLLIIKHCDLTFNPILKLLLHLHGTYTVCIAG